MNQGAFSAVINGVEHAADDIGTLVSQAANELASAGIGTFGGMEAFIQFLIHLGEDPVHVISTLAAHILQYGGEVTSVLEDLANGVLSHGLTGYFTLKTNQALSPVRDALNQQTTRGNQIAELHQTTITTMRSKLTMLTASSTVPGMAWQGEGADAMNASFEDISQVLNQLNDQIQHNGQQAILNRTFLQVLEFTGELAAAMAVLDILLVTASCIIVVFTGGAAAPVALLIDGGLLALEADILLALLATNALAWLIGTLAIYAINHPISLSQHVNPTVTTVPGDAQYPKPRKLTTEEADEVQKIVDEIEAMGFNVDESWIEYLMRILGAKMTATQAGAVIRCMFRKGYISKIETGRESTASKVQQRLKSAWNSLSHLTQQDQEGAWKDVHSNRVTYTGSLPSGAKHLDEVTNAVQSLQNLKDALLDAITDPNTPENMRQVYQNLYDACQQTIDAVSKNVYGSDPPLTWSDKGMIPFGDDIISKSGCL